MRQRLYSAPRANSFVIYGAKPSYLSQSNQTNETINNEWQLLDLAELNWLISGL